MGLNDFRKQSEKDKTVRELTARFVKFEKDGDEVFGRLLSVSAVTSSAGGPDYNGYMFQTDGGVVKCSPGGATDKEWAGQIAVGNIYLVTFHGKVTLKGGRTVNKFSLKHYPERGMNEEPSENDPV